jgi:hypothetical protein
MMSWAKALCGGALIVVVLLGLPIAGYDLYPTVSATSAAATTNIRMPANFMRIGSSIARLCARHGPFSSLERRHM